MCSFISNMWPAWLHPAHFHPALSSCTGARNSRSILKRAGEGPQPPGWYPRLYSHCCILQHFCEMEGPRQRWLCHRPLSAALPKMLNSKTIATFIIKRPPPVFCWEMMELLSTVRTFLSLVRTPGGHAWCRSYGLAYMPTRYHPAMLLCTQSTDGELYH